MTEPTSANPATNRYLWTAVGVLGAATVALGAVVLNPHWRSGEAPQAPVAPVSAAATAALAPASAASATLPVATQDSLGTTEAVVPVAVAEPKPTPARVKIPREAAKKVVFKPAATAAVASTVPPPPPSQAPVVTTEWPAEPSAPSAKAKSAKVLCPQCGTVQSVTPVQRDAVKGSGLGVLVGGALGGLLGNQVGGGNGKTVATVLGAVGGGWAGNEVEKRMKKEITYQVTVRMQDGSTRQFEQADPIAVGAAVSVDGGVIRLQTTPE